MSAFINDKLVPVKSNVYKSRLFASYPYPENPSQFPVPQTVFTDASGKEIGRILGKKLPAEFQETMDSILDGLVT